MSVGFSCISENAGTLFWLKEDAKKLPEKMAAYLEGGSGIRGIFAEIRGTIDTEYYWLQTAAHAALAVNDGVEVSAFALAGIQPFKYEEVLDRFFCQPKAEILEVSPAAEEPEARTVTMEFDADEDVDTSFLDEEEEEASDEVFREYAEIYADADVVDYCACCGHGITEAEMSDPNYTGLAAAEDKVFCSMECFDKAMWS